MVLPRRGRRRRPSLVFFQFTSSQTEHGKQETENDLDTKPSWGLLHDLHRRQAKACVLPASAGQHAQQTARQQSARPFAEWFSHQRFGNVQPRRNCSLQCHHGGRL